MTITESEILTLHRRLVGLPSVSGSEIEIADFVENWMRIRAPNVHRTGNSVIGWYGRGPYLLLNSHLDTVPECEGWSREPYDVEPSDGAVFGLGSNDAKGAMAALMVAFDSAVKNELPGSIAIALVEGEETTGKGTSNSLKYFRDRGMQISAAVVGEPTALDIAVAQKGLLILEIIAESTPCHAARATQLGVDNPIVMLAADLVTISNMEWPNVDPFLGPMSLQPTVVKGGTAKNQVPGVATAIVDVRTTNTYSHNEVVQRVEQEVGSRVNVVSTRLEPVATSEFEGIVRSARSARPESVVFGSATMSDMVFLKNIPVIKVGPGDSQRSHTPDEYIREEELLEGVSFYTTLIQEYLKLEKTPDSTREATA